MRRVATTRLASALSAAALLAGLAVPAMGHEAGASAGAGFLTGFRHPVSGIDHVLAMLAVGMWGAQLGQPSIWVLPVAFPLVMAFGGVAGILGVPFPPVEFGVALSVVVLGAAIALDRRPPLPAAVAVVGVFALFHGYAHGMELPGHAGAAAYSAGFVIATGLIHVTGILIGLVTELRRGLALLRTGGAAIALAGIYLTARLVGG